MYRGSDYRIWIILHIFFLEIYHSVFLAIFLCGYFILFRGCFLTSSLIATLALSLTIPLTMLADVLWKGVGNYMYLCNKIL